MEPWGLRPKKFQTSVAVPPAPVWVPGQRPLVPSVASVTSMANDRMIMKWSWGLCTDALAMPSHSSPIFCQITISYVFNSGLRQNTRIYGAASWSKYRWKMLNCYSKWIHITCYFEFGMYFLSYLLYTNSLTSIYLAYTMLTFLVICRIQVSYYACHLPDTIRTPSSVIAIYLDE